MQNLPRNSQPALAAGQSVWRRLTTRWPVLSIVVVALLLPGCQLFRNFNRATERLPVAFSELPSQEQLLANLEVRRSTVKQLDSRITVAIPGAPKIRGSLQVELPNRMRMKAGVMGASALGVDVGSNDNEFWVFSQASIGGQTPALYFANHRQFELSPMRQTLPLEPRWLIDALGVTGFLSTDRHQGPTLAGNGLMKLTTYRTTAAGPQYIETTMAIASGLIIRQTIYDKDAKLVAYFDSTNYKNYQYQDPFRPSVKTTISLPHHIEIFVADPNTQQLTKMVAELSDFSVNKLNGSPDQMWAMPDPVGIPKVNLAGDAINPQRLEPSTQNAPDAAAIPAGFRNPGLGGGRPATRQAPYDGWRNER